MKALILSSGFGTRLYPLTKKTAKGLLEVRGRRLIDYVVDKIPPDVDILVNVNRKFEEDFRRWSEASPRDITICVEDVHTPEESLGAIGSITHWIGEAGIDEDLMVIAGDNYFEFDMSRFIDAYDGRNTVIAVQDIGDLNLASKYGVIATEGNRITEFVEKPKEPRSTLIATACWIVPRRVFPVMTEFAAGTKRDNLGSFIEFLLDRSGNGQEDEVHAFPFDDLWLDIGSIEVYESLNGRHGL
jgi:glucose-1-phosphate thymidylyltransferase